MARIRTIKPEFFLHEGLAELSPLHRLLFIGLWTLADREGRMEDKPRRIKACVFPWEDCDVDALLADLDAADLVHRYADDAGDRFLSIPSFGRHQRPHPKEAASACPTPPSREKKRLAVKGFSAIPSSPAGKGREGDLGREGVLEVETPPAPSGFAGLPAPEAIAKSAQPDRRQAPRPAPGSDIDFFAWAQNRRTEARPGLIPETPSATYPTWFKKAADAVSGDLDRLRGAWLWWLKDDWGASRSPPFAFRCFQSDQVWIKHVPEAQQEREPDKPQPSKLNRPVRLTDPEELQELLRDF